MGKRAVILPGPAISDINACRRCHGPMTGRACLVEGGVYRSFPTCPRCYPNISRATFATGDAHRGTKPALLKLGRILNETMPPPKPRVVVVRRRDPDEGIVTGLRAKLAARNLGTWEEGDHGER